MLQFRTMRNSDISFAISLCDREKWGVTRDDFERILRLDPKGSFIAYDDARRLGLVTSTSYGRKLAWIGNVVVDKNSRGREIGHRLVEFAVSYLRKRRVQHVALYCFKESLGFYERLGFVKEAAFVRLKRKGKQAHFRLATFSFDDRPRLAQLLAIDKRAFGADRSKLVRLVIADRVGFWIAMSDGSNIRSCMMVRKYDDVCEFGPWISMKPRTDELREMLRRALNETDGRSVEVSSLRSNREVLELLRDHGFRVLREGYRMFYGERAHVGDDRAQCALGFLDKG
jgi:ribosomal protein S18 acetylase RimI-like enzyme